MVARTGLARVEVSLLMHRFFAAYIALTILCAAPVAAAPAVLSLEQEQGLETGDSFSECEGCPEMVVVPAGTFVMGSEANVFAQPLHDVRIAARFAVSSTEVSVAQYEAFIEATGHSSEPGCSVVEDVYNGYIERREELSWRDPGFPQTPAHPVTCVTWNDAEAYVAWLAQVTGKPYRLLTEAEWEYAARGGTTTPYAFGADTSDICLYGNGADKTMQYSAERPDVITDIHDFACSDGYVFTAPVGSFAANPFGLYDMQGNVYEWLVDCSAMLATGRGYQDAPADGSAWMLDDCRSHAMRGGGWASAARELQVADRAEGALPMDDTGIRVARDLLPYREGPQ
ncbi:formylglycine-generating enzyme family protein [Devosia ginsengisoli]|uniref:Formylglycine-generating enzyme family protein n=2 Tax=Devosia ginsengisoli TaxID=400770 RepID=A0A5B8LRN8_9HYPH|nr:formylglycine-generating enzyme family protein [Devosia ginsengisoli]